MIGDNPPNGFLNLSALTFEAPELNMTALDELRKAFELVTSLHNTVVSQLSDVCSKLFQQPHVLGIHCSEQIAEGMTRFKGALQKAECVGKYGWTIPLYATPGEIVSIIDVISDEATADAAFVWYFTCGDEAQLKVLIQRILKNPELQYWRPALEEAVTCLREKKYRACIALLLPLVDGLCARRFNLPEFEKGRRRRAFLEAKRQYALTQYFIEGAMWLSFIGFADVVFCDVDFQKRASWPSVLNRHIILHGRDIPQARLEDCLRLLQAIDTITELTL
jgi:hypothetical protein